ncbi:hypothetical protein P7H15_26185 [Paenibacillus larvae]|nr:hypothetical protein [Paenibacillus larvae]MDT2295609.1 hypothetical protein [Paenibacillus larvae]
MSRTLQQLEDWQWKQLYDKESGGKSGMQGNLQDWNWMVKIENRCLTVDELAWLNNHILASSL